MKTKVIEVKELEKEIDILFMGVQLQSHYTYEAILKNGKKIKLKADSKYQTYVIFDDGKIRFNRPVKIVDDGK
jgi:hypothetical protein|tara:strand:- start:1 stop:219 length:219 start_codon:yes stop_codon:yes gene_type:complete